MKTVGIIGGLGPGTTAEFYLAIIEEAFRKNKIARPPILIWNVPLNYILEETILLKARGEGKYIPYLVKAAKVLEKGGADFLVMPCNTLHMFIEDIRKSVKVPVVSILDEVVNFLAQEKIEGVGILATSLTLKNKLYENKLKERKIKQIKPNRTQQVHLDQIINRIVKSKNSKRDEEIVQDMVESFHKKGIKAVILACTDLQLLNLGHPHVAILDSMEILARATVGEILGG